MNGPLFKISYFEKNKNALKFAFVGKIIVIVFACFGPIHSVLVGKFRPIDRKVGYAKVASEINRVGQITCPRRFVYDAICLTQLSHGQKVFLLRIKSLKKNIFYL